MGDVGQLHPIDQILGQVAGRPARPLGQGHRPVDLIVGPVRATDDRIGAPERLVERGERARKALAQDDGGIGHGTESTAASVGAPARKGVKEAWEVSEGVILDIC
jgi:hypothetical protein